jgi:hypothetical protein
MADARNATVPLSLAHDNKLMRLHDQMWDRYLDAIGCPKEGRV